MEHPNLTNKVSSPMFLRVRVLIKTYLRHSCLQGKDRPRVETGNRVSMRSNMHSRLKFSLKFKLNKRPDSLYSSTESLQKFANKQFGED